DAVHRVRVVRRLDHVVLLVSAQTVLRSESGCKADVVAGCERIERMREIARDGGRMRKQRDPAAGERLAKPRLRGQAIDAELHHDVWVVSLASAQSSAANPLG